MCTMNDFLSHEVHVKCVSVEEVDDFFTELKQRNITWNSGEQLLKPTEGGTTQSVFNSVSKGRIAMFEMRDKGIAWGSYSSDAISDFEKKFRILGCYDVVNKSKDFDVDDNLLAFFREVSVIKR